jgi:hypothetical protein
MPTKTGVARPRGVLGLRSDVPASAMKTKPARNRLTSQHVKSAKPKPHRVGRRETP